MANPPFHSVRKVQQELAYGDILQSRLTSADTMFANTGRKLYVIGDIDGNFRPRSNPYDLYSFGKPHPDDPLANKLQGVWAQPVKALDSYAFLIETGGQYWHLIDAERFTQTFACAQFDYRRGNLEATRRDFVAQDLPILFTTLSLRNLGADPIDIKLSFAANFDLEDAWFTSFVESRNQGEKVTIESGRLVARANVAPAVWAVAVGGIPSPNDVRLWTSENQTTGEFIFMARLEPEAELSWTFAVVVETAAGSPAALRHLEEWLPQCETLLSAKQALYTHHFESGPRLHSPNPNFNAAFDLARANMQLLEAESPALGSYFYAGLENFPFWFSCDGAYGVPGLVAAGLTKTTLNAVLVGAHFQQDGRVPHQISPSGRIAFQGNAGETPLWVTSLWDAYRWTGDRDFLESAYSAAVRGLFDYMLGKLNPDGDGYPIGPGMVEREDMGVKKLDNAAYLWAGLNSLVQLATAMHDAATATRAQREAESIASRFHKDWWDAANGTYAMSLEVSNNAQRPVSHWAVVTPLEVGLALPPYAQTTLATLRQSYLNDWGVKHTVGDDERVWTLPTAALSRAAYRYNDTTLGFEMLAHLAQTLEHGSIGMFHELIPDGMCFVQLWSATSFVRGIVEDLMGMDVRADQHTLTLTPKLPTGWDFAEMENISFGEHTLTVRVARGRITLTHLRGPVPLQVIIRSPRAEPIMLTLAPGSTAQTISQADQP